MKQHLAGAYKNVTTCPKCPPQVREEIKEYMVKKKKMNMLPHFMNWLILLKRMKIMT